MSPILNALFVGLALTAEPRSASQLHAQWSSGTAALEIVRESKVSAGIRSLDGSCAFANGITICTSVVESTYTTSRSVVSGCLYGPNAIPGRRTRTFEDSYLVTVTTTTKSHGKSGPVYDTSSTSSQTLISSQQISDVCEPI